LYLLVIQSMMASSKRSFFHLGVLTATTYALVELLMRTKLQVCVSMISNN